MIIIWGRMVVRKSIGRVADFCSICREFRPFRGTKVELVGHLYFIPLGRRTHCCYTRACESCGTRYDMQPEAYESLSCDRRADLDGLIAETQPRIAELWKGRLETEKRALDGRLSPHERRTLILEPFRLLDHRAADRASRVHVDEQACLGVALAFVLPFLAMTMLTPAFRPPSTVPAFAALVGIAFGLGFSLLALATQARRYARRRILPMIVETLRPIAPTAEELDDAIGHLEREGATLGRLLKPRDVRDAFGRGASNASIPGLAS